MSGYKDDLEAAHERIQSLEREVSRLRAEDKGKQAAAPKPAGAVRLGAGLVLVAAGGLGVVGTVLYVFQEFRDGPLLFAMMAAAVACGLVCIALAGRFVLVLRPWQAAIVSGMGARVAVGGRLIRLPVVQQVYLMDLRARLVDWSLEAACARGGEPIDARGYLAFAIQPNADDVQRAAERFLDRGPAEIEQVARQSVERAARSVIARLAPGELDHREKVNDEIHGEVSGELHKVGLGVLSLGLLDVRPAGGRP